MLYPVYMQSLSGKFIVFDGPDGCGKTTQRDLLSDYLTSKGLSVVKCKDPGGSVIGDRIRHVLLDYDLSEMDVRCETMLFMASRAQLVGEIVEPSLKEGSVVLCDRFVSSTCAYQTAAGYDAKKVIDVAPYAISDTWPDLTIILDISAEEGFERTGRKPHQAGKNRKKDACQHNLFEDAVTDAMEARPLDFHRKVREAFLNIKNIYPRPVVTIDSHETPEKIHDIVINNIKEHFNI